MAAVTIAGGMYLVATGGDRSTARILLVIGMLYAVVVLIDEWRERSP